MSGINGSASGERQPLLPSQSTSPSALTASRPITSSDDYGTIEQQQQQQSQQQFYGDEGLSPEEQAQWEEQVAQESAFAAFRDATTGVNPDSSAFAVSAISISAGGGVPHPNSSSISQAVGGGSAITTPAAPAVPAPGTRSTREVLVILSALWIGSVLAAMDGTIVASILTRVGSDFKVSKEISWLGTSYLLSQTAFQPLYGKAADIFGRRASTLFASAIFLIGSLLCGLSRTFTELCIARVIAGIGGGGLTTMATIVTSDVVSLRSRGVWQGVGNLWFATGAAAGAPLGGALADGLGWRWGFLIQVPICMLHFAMVAWKVDIPAGPGSMSAKLKRIDGLGALTLVSSVTLVLVALSLGGNERAWSDSLVLGTLFGGLGGSVLFVAVEKYVAREPLLPLRTIFRRTPGAVALTALFTSMSQFGLIFNVPLYFATVEQQSASKAGAHLIPNAVLASSCSLLSGLIIARTGKYKTLLLLVSASGFLGPLAMLFWRRGGIPEWFGWLPLPFAGVGYGGILTITLVALIAAVQPTDMAGATGGIYLFRAVGSITGVSLSQALLQMRLQQTLSAAQLPPKIIAAIRQDVDTIKTLPRGLRDLAIDSYDQSLHSVFIAIFVTGVLAHLATYPIRELPLPSAPTKPAAAAAAPTGPAATAPRAETIAEEDEE